MRPECRCSNALVSAARSGARCGFIADEKHGRESDPFRSTRHQRRAQRGADNYYVQWTFSAWKHYSTEQNR